MRTLLFGLFVVAGVSAQWGPATGSLAPPFALQDQNARIRNLAMTIEKNGAIVVFYRSADW